MQDFSYIDFEEIIKSAENELYSVCRELELCPAGVLNVENRGTYTRYNHLIKYKNGNTTRQGITSNKDLIGRLARKAFLECKRIKLKKDIEVLKSASRSIDNVDNDSIVNSLPARYQALDRSMLFTRIATDLSYEGNISNQYLNDWINSEYEQYDKHPENKKHIVSNGIKVRSKSEVIIAESLIKYGVAFHYEEVLTLNSKDDHPIFRVPDFTIKRTDGKIIYWEHFGMIDNKPYKSDHIKKLSLYADYDIGEWDNLIVTYDRLNGTVDTKEIDFLIKNRLKL